VTRNDILEWSILAAGGIMCLIIGGPWIADTLREIATVCL
jgi:hypothetical protein